MKTYKILHVESGLFYRPVYHKRINNKYVKCNLSEKGKIYQNRPTLKHIDYYNDIYGRCLNRKEGEFEIIQFNTRIENIDKIQIFLNNIAIDSRNYKIDVKNNKIDLLPDKMKSHMFYDQNIIKYIIELYKKI